MKKKLSVANFSTPAQNNKVANEKETQRGKLQYTCAKKVRLETSDANFSTAAQRQ
jgi:hypothetical protein